MNQARKRTGTKKVLSMILVLVMLLSLLSMAAFTLPASETGNSKDAYEYNIMFLDCGRKYYSVDSIEQIIDNASAARFNYIQLAVGNDGLRFLLDDMSLTVGNQTYDSDAVKVAIQKGNADYNAIFSKKGNEAEDSQELRPYNPTTNELTQSEMDMIIAYAQTKGMGVIPCVNTPGHMDAILSAANSLTGTNCSYRDSVRTIDVTNTTAVAFTKALLQKYITYFAGKGCKLFNMGADEYANDKFTGGAMGFGNLQSTGKYSNYVTYVNQVAKMIKDAGMKPMAFNDGIYFNNNTYSGTFDTDILICYWSSGWGSYNPMSAANLADKGFKLINTHGDYYWVLGKNAKCSAETASNFNTTAFYGSTVNNPAGSMFCIWSDFPGAETEASVISKTAATIAAFGAALPKGTSGTVTPTPTTPTPDTSTNTKTIHVAVNGTATETVSGTYSGPYTTGDTSIATVTTSATTTERKLTAVTSIESGHQYLIVNNRRDESEKGNLLTTQTSNWYGNSGLKLTGEASTTSTELWTIQESGSGYKVMRGSNCLTIGENTASVQSDSAVLTLSYNTSGGYWNISQNSCYLNNLGNSETAGGWKWENNNNAPTDGGSQWTIYEITGGEQTTITFNGVAEGTTSVTIGGVTYTIHVTAEDLNNVTPLTIEYWITNGKMPDANGNTTVSISATKDGVASESGVSVADIVSPTGNKDGRQQEYWQSKLLDKNKVNNSTSGTEEQTTEKGDDETLSGFAFTKVRYWGGAWQVYTTDWVTVKNTDQLVAYYMEIVKITNKNGAENLHVNAADWGTKGDGTGNWGYIPESSRCSVSVQLVYEDGSTSPSATTADDLKSKTIVYGYTSSNGRGLGTMVFNGKDNYQIFKVTAETGTMSSTPGSDNTVTVTDFSWKNNEETVWEGAATDSVSIGNPTNNPNYDAPYDNLAWNTSNYNKNNAILIRVYVKSIPKAGALTVNYFVQGNADPFYHYGINVVEDTTFDAGFKCVEDADAPGKARLINNIVTNYDGEQQEVQSDLSKMTEIGAQYRYSDYKFVEATRSEDGKTVNLYYTFKAEKTFVIDFGLPLVIRPADVQSGFEGVTFTQVDVTKKSTYANIAVDASGNITYTLNQPIDGADTFGVKYHGYRGAGSGGDVTYTITVIPATSVYYEDSFAKFTNGTGKAADAKWTTDKDDTAAKATTTQALSALGSKDVYGHDAAYADSTKLSMGSAHKVTVSKDMYVKGDTTTTWPTATFTFKGTGFDVISLTDNNSGAISVKVYAVNSDGTEKQVEGTLVNNYYGYTCKDGKWTVTPTGDNNALYQIPVIKIGGLDYGTYKVVITAAYATYADKTGDNQYSFWLDAIRVYDPMGKDNATYKKDGEGYPQYIKLHDALVAENVENALFIDGAAKADITDYKNYGPNNEVYLANGQAITFNVPINAKIASVQIGAKAPDGSAAQMVVTGGNGLNQELSTATEMYYKIGTAGDSFTITNTGTGILSLTNLKITFTDKPGSTIALSAPTAEEQTAAVMSVRALFAAPEQTFEPEHFTAKWSRNVRKGGTATLTVKASADVESITVNGEEITAYTTKTARSFWGSKETYHVFTYRVTNAATADYSVCALNADGVASDPITATLTVRPSIRDWWNGIFDKWKH